MLGDVKEAYAWLFEDGWIALNFGSDDFPTCLENNYFKPGTPKNAEFEALLAHTMFHGHYGISVWFRIKDTTENRNSLRAAMSEFYGIPLLSSNDLDRGLRLMRDQLQEHIRISEGVLELLE